MNKIRATIVAALVVPGRISAILLHEHRFRLTPHIGWGSAEARTRLVEGIAANIRDWMNGSSVASLN